MARNTMFCLMAVVAGATAASIFGGASIDANAAAAGAQAVFPKIPGINAPLFGFSLLPTSNSSSSFPSFPSLPDVNSLIPFLPNNTNATSTDIPSISGFPSSLSNIPGVGQAIQQVQNRIALALGTGRNFTEGIQTALEQAFQSGNPTAGVRTLITTILDASLIVARNCPLFVVGARVLEEGIRLSIEVARAARNVAFGSG